MVISPMLELCLVNDRCLGLYFWRLLYLLGVALDVYLNLSPLCTVVQYLRLYETSFFATPFGLAYGPSLCVLGHGDRLLVLFHSHYSSRSWAELPHCSEKRKHPFPPMVFAFAYFSFLASICYCLL